MSPDTKRCSKCGMVKPLDDGFYTDGRASDGKQSQCKRCMNDKAAAYNARNREQSRRLVAASKARPEARLKALASQRRRRRANPAAPRAHKLVARAIASGQLVRPDSCSQCGRPCKPVAHHDDYAQPLNVRWLCASCHSHTDARRPRIIT